MGADQSKPVLDYGKDLGRKAWKKAKNGCCRNQGECHCPRCTVETHDFGVQTNFSDEDDEQNATINNNAGSSNHEAVESDDESDSTSDDEMIDPNDLYISSNAGYRNMYCEKFNRSKKNSNNINYFEDSTAFNREYKRYYNYKKNKMSRRNNNSNANRSHTNNNGGRNNNNDNGNQPSMAHDDSYFNSNNQNYGYGSYGYGNYYNNNNYDEPSYNQNQSAATAFYGGNSYNNYGSAGDDENNNHPSSWRVVESEYSASDKRTFDFINSMRGR